MTSQAEAGWFGGDPRRDVDRRLGELGPGLTEALLAEAVDRAMAKRNSVSALAPPWYEGSTLNAGAVSGLMELLIPHGWRRGEEQGVCTAISPDGATRIAVATGDRRTGTSEPGVAPKTRNKRGAVAERAIAANEMPTLFEYAARDGGEPEIPRIVTWYMLVAVVRQEVQVELSRPKGQDKLGRISEWSERIVLSPLSTDSRIDIVNDEGDDEDMDIDIDIPRREE